MSTLAFHCLIWLIGLMIFDQRIQSMSHAEILVWCFVGLVLVAIYVNAIFNEESRLRLAGYVRIDRKKSGNRVVSEVWKHPRSKRLIRRYFQQ